MTLRQAIIFVLIIFSFSRCQETEADFKSFTYDRNKDLFETLAKNLDPDENYTYWAFMRSTHGIGNATILHEEGDISQRKLLNLRFELKGFFNWGHHADMYYYILAVRNDNVHKIQTKESLINFLDTIDTTEEAFLIARIHQFLIDPSLSEGNSFRKIKDGYELLVV